MNKALMLALIMALAVPARAGDNPCAPNFSLNACQSSFDAGASQFATLAVVGAVVTVAVLLALQYKKPSKEKEKEAEEEGASLENLDLLPQRS